MDLFRRKKKLFEYDPEELDLELLLTLRGSLVVKLIQVNDNLISRYRTLVSVGGKLRKRPGTQESTEILEKGAKKTEQFNEMLKKELEDMKSN